MIAWLEGMVIQKRAPYIFLNVQGVGYELHLPDALWQRIHVGRVASFWIHTHEREDGTTGYGFEHEADRLYFQTLLQATGVGPKLAMAILSNLPLELCWRALERKEAHCFSGITGVGKKTAERLIVELQGKFRWIQEVSGLPASMEWGGTSDQSSGEEDAALFKEAAQVLVSLGYRVSEAERVLHEGRKQLRSQVDVRTVQDWVKWALRRLATVT